MSVAKESVWAALRTVQDPELFKDIVTLNMVKDIQIEGGKVTVKVELTTPACPMKDRIQREVRAAVEQVPGVKEVTVNLTANVKSGGVGGPAKNPIPGVKNVIAVGAGKGGVGKSTVAVNLAFGLALQGAKVGIMDGDIYGPSIPTMVGLPFTPPLIKGNQIVPFEVMIPPQENQSGDVVVKVMSIGFLVEKEKALIWRGPMAHGAIKQFLEQVDWGDLDYLIVDLPPGTGDVSLTLAQTVPVSGAVIVATPQEVALMDARRAVRMFQQLNIPVLGVVENMSYFICEHGTEYDIFGRGGAQNMAQEMGIPFLGAIPINMQLRVHSDAGTPVENFTAASGSSTHLKNLVSALAGQISIRNLQQVGEEPLEFKVS